MARHDDAYPAFPACHGFLTDVQPCAAHVPGAMLLRGRYDVARFTPALFPALGIRCPDALQSANPRRQAEFLAGRALAKLALGNVGVPYADMPIRPDRRPQWPDGIAGSISHARGHVACLVGTGVEWHPGIDIETIAQGQALTAIESIVLLPGERTLLTGLPAAEAACTATLIFSGKEALFKALFPMVGKVFGFAAAELVAMPTPAFLDLRLTADLTPTLPRGAVFRLHWMGDADHVMTWLVAAPDGCGATSDTKSAGG